MNASKIALLALLPLSLVVGCGNEDPGTNNNGNDGGGGDTCTLPAGALLPWNVGNKWTYRVIEAGMPSQKVTTIESQEPVGGIGPHAAKMAHRVVTKKGANDQTVSWQAPDGNKIVRYREQSFSASNGALELEEHWDPYKLHIDGSADKMKFTNKAWFEEYRETKLEVGGMPATATAMDFWMVEAECEKVVVDNKPYNALRLSKTGGGGDTKRYWYVPGIGKVKETGGQTEELLSWEIIP
jgi:hypothetical protein